MAKIFNLQMFADANGYPAPNTQTTGTTTLAPEMKTYYDTELLENAKPELVHTQFGKKVALPKGKGKTIEFRRFKTFSKKTTPLTEGVTPDGSAMEVTYSTATVAQYGDYTTISDVLEMTAIDPIILECTSEHGANAGRTKDTLVRDVLAGGTNFLMPGGKQRSALTVTDVITGDLVAQAATILKKQNAPKINGYYVAIIHPSVAYDLRKDPAWVSANTYVDNENLLNGEIGRLHGVRFVETTEAKIVEGGNNCVVYFTLFLGKDAYGLIDPEGCGLEMIVKPLGSAGSADPLDQRQTVGWKFSDATKILYQERLLRLETSSSFGAKDVAN